MTKLVMTSRLLMTNDQFSGHDIYWTGHEINLTGHEINRAGHDSYWTGHDQGPACGHVTGHEINLCNFQCFKYSLSTHHSWPENWSWPIITIMTSPINLMTRSINIMTRKLVIGHGQEADHDQLGHRLDESQNFDRKKRND